MVRRGVSRKSLSGLGWSRLGVSLWALFRISYPETSGGAAVSHLTVSQSVVHRQAGESAQHIAALMGGVAPGTWTLHADGPKH